MTSGFSQPKPFLLFDWGDTVMRDDPHYDGPMKSWPQVTAVPGAVETLQILRGMWGLALATNAAASTKADIWAALGRVGLDILLDKVYCFRTIGHKKPSPAFFAYILADLKLPPSELVMIGDAYESDVLGAVESGIRAVWFNPHNAENRRTEMIRTVHDLRRLPAVLESFTAAAGLFPSNSV